MCHHRRSVAGAVSPVALVTGAARGIGAATVDALVVAGWQVVAFDRAADDPALGYALASRADLDAVVARHGRTPPPAIRPPRAHRPWRHRCRGRHR